MWLKLIIVVLFLAMVASLFSGFIFLTKDQGSGKRLFYALGTRIALALLLLIAVGYGIYSGQLSSTAPWDRQLHPERTAPSPL